MACQSLENTLPRPVPLGLVLGLSSRPFVAKLEPLFQGLIYSSFQIATMLPLRFHLLGIAGTPMGRHLSHLPEILKQMVKSNFCSTHFFVFD